MIVECLVNKGKDLPGYQHGLYYTEHTSFRVSIGEEYQVYAMSWFRKGLLVLLYNDVRYPSWYPIELFRVVDGSVPGDWRFARRDGGEYGTEGILGYSEMVEDENHSDRLEGLDRDALRAFLRQVEKRTGEKATLIGDESI